MLSWPTGVSKNSDVDSDESLMGVEYDLSWTSDKDTNSLSESTRQTTNHVIHLACN